MSMYLCVCMYVRVCMYVYICTVMLPLYSALHLGTLPTCILPNHSEILYRPAQTIDKAALKIWWQ